MRIGFDLDGVLLTQSEVEIVLSKGNEQLEEYYYKTREPQLNPYMFASNLDDLCIITCRAEKWRDLTAKQCAQLFPSIQLYHISVPVWTDNTKWDEWFKSVANEKAWKINDLKLDVYFEDMPVTVFELRSLCKATKIIQYGGGLA